MAVYLAPGVYVEEFDSGPVPLAGGATAVAAFVGFTERIPTKDDKAGAPPDYAPRLVTSWTQYKSFYGGFGIGDWTQGHRPMLPQAVYGYFNNGGSMAYIVPIEWTEPRDPEKPELEQASTDYYERELPDGTEATGIPAADDETATALTVRTGAEQGQVAIAVEPASEAPDDPAQFGLRVRVDGKEVLHVDGIATGGAGEAVKTKLAEQKLDEDLLTVIDGAGNPKRGKYALVLPEPNPKDIGTADIAGDLAERTGIESLKIHDDVTMLIVPDLYNIARYEALNDETLDDAGKQAVAEDWREVHLGTWKAVQTMMITHCENETNRMAILDPPPSRVRADQIEDWRSNTAMYDSMHAAFYYPWIKVTDPVEDGEMFVPPSGHMAGVWARTDSTRGVWKAPANEVVLGALNVQYKMTSAEQNVLNPNGINAIRPFGTRGIRVWGARTLSSNALWNYVPVRRLFSWIEKTVMDGTQWVVFEPNDQTTWDRVTRTVSNFLTGLWRDGALFGATPDAAFYVKCDSETNPPDSIDLGKLVCEVGIAPVKPAEFVIFRVTQWKPE